MKILNINARYPGARNDAFIWSASPIRRAMEYHYNRGERRTWLIGKSEFILRILIVLRVHMFSYYQIILMVL